MGIVSALGITLQWGLGLAGLLVTNDQAAAMSILLFPFVHLMFIKIGVAIDRQQVPMQRRANDNGKEKP